MARALREEDPCAEDREELENPSAEGLQVWDSEDPAAQRAAAVKRDQQNADALVDIAQVYLAGGTQRKTSTADHYQVLVHVDEAALRCPIPINSAGQVGRCRLLWCHGVPESNQTLLERPECAFGYPPYSSAK